MDMTYNKLLPAVTDVKMICCLMLADIGDIMVTTPTISAIREFYPNAKITVIVRKPFERLLEYNPDVDELIVYDPRSIFTKLILLFELACRRCDLWIDLHVPTFNTVSSNQEVFSRNNLFKRLLRPHFSIGYKVLSKQDLTHPLPIPEPDVLKNENIVISTLRLVGAEKQYRHFGKVFTIEKSEQLWAKERLAKQSRRTYVGIFFGSKQSADIWPDEHLRRLLEELLTQQPDIHILLIGGQLERDKAIATRERLSDSDKKRVTNFCGESDLGQSAALISHCCVFISTDAGPMHIADALRVPTVALFSSKNHPKIWRPLYSEHILLNHKVDCGPCFSAICHAKTSCMSLITPQEVAEATKQLLKDRELKAS